MGARASRLIERLEADASASDGRGVLAYVKDSKEDPAYAVSLDSLSGGELMRACANIGFNSKGITNPERISGIQRIVTNPDYRPNVFIPKTRAERRRETPNVSPSPVVVPDSVIPAPIPDVSNDAAPNGDSGIKVLGPDRSTIEALIESLTPNIDVSALSETITENVLHAIDARMRDIETAPVRVVMSMPTYEKDFPRFHHTHLPRITEYVARGHHVFLTGPAGSGKTTIAKQVAEMLNRECEPMSCNPSMMDSRFFGFIDGNGVYHSTAVRRAVEFGRVLAIDEMDNGHPSMMTGLNLILSAKIGDWIDFPDGKVQIAEGFACIAGANTWGSGPNAEYVGRNPIDKATLNRFTRKLMVDYDLRMERAAAMVYSTDSSHAAISEWIDRLQSIRRNIAREKIQVIVSPRDVIAGAMDIAAGDSVNDCLEYGIFAGITEDIRARVMA